MKKIKAILLMVMLSVAVMGCKEEENVLFDENLTEEELEEALMDAAEQYEDDYEKEDNKNVDPLEHDLELLDSLYNAATMCMADPDYSDSPYEGEVDAANMPNTQWGAATLETLGVSSIEELEGQFISDLAGEKIEMRIDEYGSFIIKCGDVVIE